MDKYKNGKIYTIRYKNDDTLIYVGSTVTPLYKRFSDHKSHSKNPKNENKQLYKKMNETDLNDWYIELYEDCPCDRKEQLTQREGQVIREIGTLNKQIAGRTDQEYNKEYYQDKKEHILEKHKDRPACEISVTIQLGRSHNYTWPIYMGDQRYDLAEGDGVIYLGCDVEHWRNKCDGPLDYYSGQVFCHFVRKNGQYVDEYLDHKKRIPVDNYEVSYNKTRSFLMDMK
jgi:hypothetical protein